MKESAKWRSGREAVRTSLTSPSGREGKKAMALGHREGVESERHRDMVVPAPKAATLEVVQSKLTLHVLVDTLGAPALQGEANEFQGGRLFGQ